MSFPLVSVCVPAYNAERFIAPAIDSLLNQSYPCIEIIIVNDGSNDSTAQVLKKYEEKGIKVIHQQNKGQCSAANTAFLHSRGDYIKFFDADDLLSRDFIKNQVDRLNGSEENIASASWGRFLQDDLSSFALQHETVYKDMLPMDWLVSSFDKGPNMMQCALWLIPRKVLDISGLWDERLSLINDFDFFIRVILSSKKVLFAEDAILYYRSGLENSLSNRKSGTAMESALLSIELGINKILSIENSKRTRKICADSLQVWSYQFYPHYMNLYKRSIDRIKELGGSAYAYPSGGATKVMADLLGWKLTKRLKSYLNQ